MEKNVAELALQQLENIEKYYTLYLKPAKDSEEKYYREMPKKLAELNQEA